MPLLNKAVVEAYYMCAKRRIVDKKRNQRSTAEAQERANPAGLKQKGARPMVDMEPAQQGQAVGIR